MNFLGEQIMDGPVTIGLVSVCFAVCLVVVTVFAYFVSRFQTKEAAMKSETEIKANADKVENDLKAWIRKVETDVSKVQSSLERIGENVSYIRGRLEPTKSKED